MIHKVQKETQSICFEGRMEVSDRKGIKGCFLGVSKVLFLHLVAGSMILFHL